MTQSDTPGGEETEPRPLSGRPELHVGCSGWLYRHDYTKEELAVWVRRIRESGAKRVWAYFNNDRECYAIKNARELLRQLKRGDESSSPR